MAIPICPVCRNNPLDADARTLRLDYSCELTETSELLDICDDRLYSIVTCKDCRGIFCQLLQDWINGDYNPVPEEIPTQTQLVLVDDRRLLKMTPEEAMEHKRRMASRKIVITYYKKLVRYGT